MLNRSAKDKVTACSCGSWSGGDDVALEGRHQRHKRATTAQRLLEPRIRTEDMVSRFGGDVITLTLHTNTHSRERNGSLVGRTETLSGIPVDGYLLCSSNRKPNQSPDECPSEKAKGRSDPVRSHVDGRSSI